MPKKARIKWYVELRGGKTFAYCSTITPSFFHPFSSDGLRRGPSIGPFRTKRAAKWAEEYGQSNPHFQHVNDAERLSKGGTHA